MSCRISLSKHFVMIDVNMFGAVVIHLHRKIFLCTGMMTVDVACGDDCLGQRDIEDVCRDVR